MHAAPLREQGVAQEQRRTGEEQELPQVARGSPAIGEALSVDPRHPESQQELARRGLEARAQVADGAEPHRSSTDVGAKLFIVDGRLVGGPGGSFAAAGNGELAFAAVPDQFVSCLSEIVHTAPTSSFGSCSSPLTAL